MPNHKLTSRTPNSTQKIYQLLFAVEQVMNQNGFGCTEFRCTTIGGETFNQLQIFASKRAKEVLETACPIERDNLIQMGFEILPIAELNKGRPSLF